MPEIWRRLESVGLETTTACGDTPRGFLGSPVAGIAADEIIDPTPAILEIKRRWIGDPELANLPRKFKTAITGHPSLDVVHEINDVSLVGVVHPELGPRIRPVGRWRALHRAALAERIGVFVREEEAPEVWHGVIEIFRDYGFRRLRNKARLKFLLAEWGVEKFRHVLETEYLGHALPDGPLPRRRPGRATTSASTCRRTGATTSVRHPPWGASVVLSSAGWPTSSRRSAPGASGSPPTRSSSSSTSPSPA